MKIPMNKLRRIIKEEKRKLIRDEIGTKKFLRESVTDMVDVEIIIGDTATELVTLFGDLMSDFFDEDPEAFEGRSTREEWDKQISESQRGLSNYLEDAMSKAIQRAESELHGGDFHPRYAVGSAVR